jgi:hypothetical protein
VPESREPTVVSFAASIEPHVHRVSDLVAQYLETVCAAIEHLSANDDRFPGEIHWPTHNLSQELSKKFTGEIEFARLHINRVKHGGVAR